MKIIFLLYLLFFYMPVSIATELLLNPEFDNFSNGNLADNWVVNNWGSYNRQVTKETNADLVISGASQKLVVNHVSPASGIIFRQNTNFLAGHVYEWRFWVRSDTAGTKFKSILRSTQASSTNPAVYGAAKTYVINDQWQEVVMRGGFDQDISGFVGLWFREGDSGSLWIDHASLNDVTDTNNVGPYSTQTNIDPLLFGMHINKLGVHNIWPDVNVGLLRLWDTGTEWDDLEVSDDVWDWTIKEAQGKIDRLTYYINHVTSHSAAKILYTMGQTPTWLENSKAVPPSNLLDWEDYVGTLAERNQSVYNNAIQYWEIWNEFNYSGFYSGTIDEMLQLTQSAFSIIKAHNPNNKVLSPNVTGSGIVDLDDFLFAGGGDYFDILSTHKYLSSLKPELAIPYYVAIRDLMNFYGIAGKPLWMTEGAVRSNNYTNEQARAVVARTYLMMVAQGIENFSWYHWEGAHPIEPILLSEPLASGTSYSQGQGTWESLKPGGVAYKSTASWLSNASILFVEKNTVSGLWIMSLLTENGQGAKILWREESMQPFTIPTTWNVTTLADLSGNIVVPTSTIAVGIEPVLLNLSNAGTQDQDTDGLIDALDNCPTDDNPAQFDLDNDYIGDICDPDIDGDGLLNTDESILGTDPFNVDSDGDLISDGNDAYPLNPAKWLSDGDINNDGAVNVADILIGQQLLLGNSSIPLDQLKRGDVAPILNGIPSPDGQFNLGDLLVLERKVTGAISF